MFKNKDRNKGLETTAQPDSASQTETARAATEAAPAPQATPQAVPEAAAQAAAPAAAPAPAQPSPEAVELAALKERHVRLMADFDNFRKRQIREREELVKRANEDLLGDLLPIVDHLELALAKSEGDTDPVIKGIRLVHDQFLALLDRYGLKPIDSKGKPFDPAFHEALSQMSSATVPANMIIDQFRRGWLLAGRLLRPAQVVVSSGAPDQERAEAENDSVSD